MSATIRVYAEHKPHGGTRWRMLRSWCPNQRWDGVRVPSEPSWREWMDLYVQENAHVFNAIMLGPYGRFAVTGSGFGPPRGFPPDISMELRFLIGDAYTPGSASCLGMAVLNAYPWSTRFETLEDWGGGISHAEIAGWFYYEALPALRTATRNRDVRIVFYLEG